MLKKLHYSSTIQIYTKIQVQFQELKYDWLACIENEKYLVCITTSVSHQLEKEFFFDLDFVL